MLTNNRLILYDPIHNMTGALILILKKKELSTKI